jgi:2'-5' RNA ligase
VTRRPTGERLFLAVALDDATRHALAARLAAMAGDGLPGKVVAAGNWHLTLRFLGPTTDVSRDLLLAALDDGLDQPRFTVRLTGLGAFPRPKAATVLWIGVDDPAGGLNQIAEACEEAARAVGFDPEERPFHPHVTLARIRPPRDVVALVDRSKPAGVRLAVDAVTLYRSRLGSRTGSSYEVVDQIELTRR